MVGLRRELSRTLAESLKGVIGDHALQKTDKHTKTPIVSTSDGYDGPKNGE
jgi:pilus assembly protein TadC